MVVLLYPYDFADNLFPSLLSAVCHFSTEASADALCRCAKSELSILGNRFETFNLYAKPFPWSKPISGPGRVQNASTPRHRRQIESDFTSTMSAKHVIRQEPEGVELYEVADNSASSGRRKSLELHDLEQDMAHRRSTHRHRNAKPVPDSLEFSSSRVSLSPESIKETSTGTMSTLSTLDGEEVNFSGTSIVLK